MLQSKIFWGSLVILAFLLFLISLVSNNLSYLFYALALGLVVRYKGYTVLFSAYDEKIKAKRGRGSDE